MTLKDDWVDENTPGYTSPDWTFTAAAANAVAAQCNSHTTALTAVNVKSYGAVGNGSTDDTDAFEDTRDAAGVGGHVYVPPGTYIVNGAALSVASQQWSFAPGAIMKLPDGATNGTIVLVEGDGCTLDGGEWDGNRANVTVAESAAAVEIAAAHCTIRNASVHDTYGSGIVIHPASTTSTIDGTVVENCTVVNHVHYVGILLDCTTFANATVPSHDVRVSGCSVINTIAGLGNWAGMYILGSSTDYLQGSVVENCYIENLLSDGLAGGTYHEGFFWRYTTGIQVTGCYVRGCTLPYTFGLSDASVMAGCISIGSWFCGIEIGGDQTRCAITGCVVDGGGTAIVGVLGDNTPNNDLTITGNTFTNFDTGDGKAISLQTGGDNWVIAGNVIRAPNCGIQIYGAQQQGTGETPPTNLVIAGNLIVEEDGGTSGGYVGIYIDPVATGSRNWLIRDNQLIGWRTRGVLIDHGSSLTTSDITIRDNTYTDCNTVVTCNNVVLDNSCVTENWGTDTVASAAGTITLPPSSDVITLTGTDTVTGITASYPGRRVTLINTSTASLADGNNLKLSAAGPNSADDTITLVCDGTNWYEVGRSAN